MLDTRHILLNSNKYLADNKMDTTEVEKPSMEKKLQDSFKYEPNQSPKAKAASKPPNKPTSSNKLVNFSFL